VAQCGFAARFKTEGGLAKNIGRDGLNHGIGPVVLGADCGRALANRVAEDESQCVTDQTRLTTPRPAFQESAKASLSYNP
jgi:hypothetical protein